MKKIKVITMTISKPDMFEDRINTVIEKMANDKNVTSYTVDIRLSGETLLGVIQFETEKGEEDQ